jgi:hypothetical protein
MYLHRYLLLVLLCFQSLIFLGQEGAKRIVVVPFDRFGFESEIPLGFIGQVNEVKSEEVPDLYWKNMINELSKENTWLYFFQISETDRLILSKRLQREFKTEKPSHYGMNLTTLGEGALQQLLENYSADYILFVTRYHIQKKLLYAGRSFDGSKFIPWATHSIDYELYNKEEELIVIGDGSEISSRNPTDETYLSEGVLLSLLDRGIEELILDLYDKMKAYKGKPVFKLKKKRP